MHTHTYHATSWRYMHRYTHIMLPHRHACIDIHMHVTYTRVKCLLQRTNPSRVPLPLLSLDSLIIYWMKLICCQINVDTFTVCVFQRKTKALDSNHCHVTEGQWPGNICLFLCGWMNLLRHQNVWPVTSVNLFSPPARTHERQCRTHCGLYLLSTKTGLYLNLLKKKKKKKKG